MASVWPSACSGDMYDGVPRISPDCVAAVASGPRTFISRKAEVGHLRDEIHPVASGPSRIIIGKWLENDVAGLQVAVQYPTRMRMGNRAGESGHDPRGQSRRHGLRRAP